MYHYTIAQWLFFFYLYCFLGWCFESTYVSVKERRLVNRGFIRGPFLPLYGSGAIMMLVVSIPFQDNLPLVYLAGCVGATALEYVTGVVMESLFKVRYWDYSNQKFNFRGYICLSSTVVWGFFTILMTEVIHKPIEHFVLRIPDPLLTGMVLVLTVFISADFALSFKAALDLKDVLLKMEKTKEDILRLQKRLDVIIALVNEDISNKKEEMGRFDDLRQSMEERLQGLRTALQEKSAAHFAAFREELKEISGQYSLNLSEHTRLSTLKDFFQRDMIRSNPTMSSRKFGEALEELKKMAAKSSKDDKDKEE